MYTIRSVFMNFSLTYSENESGIRQWETLIEALTKHLKKEHPMHLASFQEEKGYQYVQIEQEFDEAIIDAMKKRGTVLSEEVIPVRLLVERGGYQVVGHSIVGASFPKKTHQTLHLVNQTYRHIWDLHRLLAETMAINELENFVRHEEELTRYLVTKHLAHHLTKENVTPLPYDGKFSFDLIKTIKRYDWLKEKTVQMEQVDAYKNIFYLHRNKKGYVKNIEQPLLQEIIVPEFIQLIAQKKEAAIREHAAHSTYSTSFQTKKGIRKKTEEKMNNNAFLSHYGLVEIDNNVPLDTFYLWEEAFLAFQKNVSFPAAMDHSLRIRRLGKQKATGIYYPLFKATVLDMESPDSYAHELGHQLDHTLSEDRSTISETMAFRPLLDLYQLLVSEQVQALGESHPFYTQWFGKGKYNQAYFLVPTEVFARSFELYLQEKKIHSMLLKQELMSAVYPRDAVYLKKIVHFFDELLSKPQQHDSAMLY